MPQEALGRVPGFAQPGSKGLLVGSTAYRVLHSSLTFSGPNITLSIALEYSHSLVGHGCYGQSLHLRLQHSGVSGHLVTISPSHGIPGENTFIFGMLCCHNRVL